MAIGITPCTPRRLTLATRPKTPT